MELGVGTVALSTMTLAMLTLEGGKLLARRLILKNPAYDFPTWVYVVLPPVLNVLWVVPLAYLGFEGFALPTNWAEFGRSVLFVIVTSLGTLAEYALTLGPLKAYSKSLK
jgi:hypothetical protein